MTIVSPALLVRLFGVPESITLPRRKDDSVTFTAYGKTFAVKKLENGEYHLRDTAIDSHSRFGDAQQIAQDIGHVLESGHLPCGRARSF